MLAEKRRIKWNEKKKTVPQESMVEKQRLESIAKHGIQKGKYSKKDIN